MLANIAFSAYIFSNANNTTDRFDWLHQRRRKFDAAEIHQGKMKIAFAVQQHSIRNNQGYTCLL
jgi:hypothetical protein